MMRFSKFFLLGLTILTLSVTLWGCQPLARSPAQEGSNQDNGLNLHPAERGENDENILFIIEIAIGLLFVASVVGILTQRLRVPYTVGLVLIGLALSLRNRISFTVSPNLFLGLLVPPLIFEAAFHLKIKDLRRDISPILILAIPGVLLTTFLVSGVLSLGAGYPLPLAFVFGSLVAAIDPVAVVALFRTLGTPKRLSVLLEGESLLNDGTAIVLFNLMVTIALTGQFTPLDSIYDFVIVSGGGIAVGVVLGLIISLVISSINEPMIETTLTSVLAFGSYLIAEEFHLSGVLAVVAAGLISGNLGPSRMSPTTKIMAFNFWEYAAYLANSFVFLLIGLQIDLGLLLANWVNVLWAILAVLVARAVTVYGLSWIGRGIPLKYKHILFWSGLRGAISLALALSLPPAMGEARLEIQTLAFGVVLFTLLFQGMTMKPLINRLGFLQRSEAKEEYERRHARAYMARASFDQLQEMYQEGFLSQHLWDVLSEPLKEHADALEESVTKAIHDDPDVEREEVENTLGEILQTQRNALQTLLREGKISEKTYSQLVNEVDTALTESQVDLVELLRHERSQEITNLMAIIVQEPDMENVTAILTRLGLPVTQLSSTGGFLGQRNNTLLIGYPHAKYRQIANKIKEASRKRVKIIRDPDQEHEVVIKGATLFTFDVERFEEL